MPHVHANRVTIPVPGGKVIEELVGAAATHNRDISIAHMTAPAGWTEPFQTPDFEEYTVVLRGTVTVECDGVVLECRRRVRVPDMGRVIDVIDRRRDVEGLHGGQV